MKKRRRTYRSIHPILNQADQKISYTRSTGQYKSDPLVDKKELLVPALIGVEVEDDDYEDLLEKMDDEWQRKLKEYNLPELPDNTRLKGRYSKLFNELNRILEKYLDKSDMSGIKEDTVPEVNIGWISG